MVAELDLKFGAIEVSLSVELRDIKLTLFFLLFLLDEGRGGEDEAQFVHALQLVLQCFEGIDGEGGGSDGYLVMGSQLRPQIIDNASVYVVEDGNHRFLHVGRSFKSIEKSYYVL